MKSELFLPKKIKVGFNHREDTYTKKLAYVIYYDQKNVLRKEKSWESWRNKKIDPIELENVPTEGFVLNRAGGGKRESYGWNTRNEFIRVYDPRNFEFEITLANLLFVLRECDCSKGKGLEGKFVYAWHGTELILLPENSEDYQNSLNYTDLQGKSVHSRDLIHGATYVTKKQQNLLFLGRMNYYFAVHDNTAKAKQNGVVKKYVFWDEKKFVYLNDLKTISKMVSDSVPDNFAELVKKYGDSAHGSRVVGFELIEKEDKPVKLHYRNDNVWSYQNFHSLDNDAVIPEGYIQALPASEHKDYEPYRYGVDRSKPNATTSCYSAQRFICLDKDVLRTKSLGNSVYKDGRSNQYYDYQINGYRNKKSFPWVEPTKQRLFAIMESGKKIEVTRNNFSEDDSGYDYY